MLTGTYERVRRVGEIYALLSRYLGWPARVPQASEGASKLLLRPTHDTRLVTRRHSLFPGGVFGPPRASGRPGPPAPPLPPGGPVAQAIEEAERGLGGDVLDPTAATAGAGAAAAPSSRAGRRPTAGATTTTATTISQG